jgi:pimeloyl-ACP methyl ester carboxylesterase
MPTITTPDGTEIFCQDWGEKTAQPIMFHHGWPLSADDWDAQMMVLLAQGYRVIAHDRRGHGRSSQVANGHDMDSYVADVSALTDALDLPNAIHVGHSTGGGEVARYGAQAKPWHRRRLGSRLYRKPQGYHRADAGVAQRGRPGGSVRDCSSAIGCTDQERGAEGLPGVAARHADHACRQDQCGFARGPERLTSRGVARAATPRAVQLVRHQR